MIPPPRRAGEEPSNGGRRSGGSAQRYRRRLAAERDEAAVYRALAARREGEEREILLALAVAEERHADHWAALLGAAGEPSGGAAGAHRTGPRARLLSWLARRVGPMLVLGLVQRAEVQRGAGGDGDAPEAMAADELVHARVVAGLAHSRRASASGVLRAAVFGVNDGLVSNLSLVVGVGAAGVAGDVVLLTGVAGLLAGALSMAAGEYVSVRTQRELLEPGGPSRLDASALRALQHGDANELALVFRAEGAQAEEADRTAARLLAEVAAGTPPESVELRSPGAAPRPVDVVGSALHAATSSFAAFAAGAVLPVLPFLVTGGGAATLWAAGLSGAALFAIGCLLGVYSGGPVLHRGLRQLTIGALAAAVTYALGLAFGVTLG